MYNINSSIHNIKHKITGLCILNFIIFRLFCAENRIFITLFLDVTFCQRKQQSNNINSNSKISLDYIIINQIKREQYIQTCLIIIS